MLELVQGRRRPAWVHSVAGEEGSWDGGAGAPVKYLTRPRFPLPPNDIIGGGIHWTKITRCINRLV